MRGIVLARMTNFIEGHSAVTAGLLEAVAAMLDGRRLGPVPRYGNGGSGEIPALGWLFGELGAERELQRKESMSLINGSPCAPTLLPAGGWGQNDVPSPSFLAYNRHDRTRGFTAGAVACLAAIAGQSLAQTGRRAPPALAALADEVLEVCPPLTERRSLGPELAVLTERLVAGIPA